jgi:hypothetical protein
LLSKSNTILNSIATLLCASTLGILLSVSAHGQTLGGWPTFAVLAKVGTHAAWVAIFISAAPY